jgi:hypothetical protein
MEHGVHLDRFGNVNDCCLSDDEDEVVSDSIDSSCEVRHAHSTVLTFLCTAAVKLGWSSRVRYLL